MSTAPQLKLTEAQVKWIDRATNGRIIYRGPRGYGRSVWERCMQRLVRMGLVVANPWGEYDLTAAGLELHESRNNSRTVQFGLANALSDRDKAEAAHHPSKL